MKRVILTQYRAGPRCPAQLQVTRFAGRGDVRAPVGNCRDVGSSSGFDHTVGVRVGHPCPAHSSAASSATTAKSYVGQAITTRYGIVQVKVTVEGSKITNVSFVQWHRLRRPLGRAIHRPWRRWPIGVGVDALRAAVERGELGEGDVGDLGALRP